MRVKKHRNLTAETQKTQRKNESLTLRVESCVFLCELCASAVSLGSQVSR
jgi:hypothetical protein